MSRCDEQLEHMTAERNHWKRKAEEYAEQVGNLRDKADRLEMYAQAFTGGAMRSLDESITRLQQERNAARADVERLVRTIANYVVAGRRQQQEAAERANAWIGEATRALEEKGEVRHLSLALAASAFHVHQMRESVYAETESMDLAIVAPDTLIQNAYEHPDHVLLVATRYIESAAELDVGLGYALDALEFEHVGLTADAILRECRRHGEPKISTLEQLGRKWIDENLRPGLKLDTLQAALKSVSAGSGGEDRSMREWRSWWKKLEATAQTAPEALQPPSG